MCSYCTKVFEDGDKALALSPNEFICGDCIIIEEDENAGYYGEFM